jgi:hypothetical protein
MGSTWARQPSHDSLSFGHNDLFLEFDPAERVTQVRDTMTGDLLKRLPRLRPGRIPSQQARPGQAQQPRQPRVPARGQAAQDAIVTETYTYAGRGGRVSNRQTRLWGYTFDLGVTYDILGNVESLFYPACSHARCDAQARTVSFGYTQGRLTSVPGYASSLSYHANGLVNQVVHTNGITDTQTTDSSGIPRPGSISFSGFAGIVGNYSYDGAANVKQIGSHRYSYDLESRITFSNLGTLGTQGFSYDRYGNRTRIVRAGVAYDYPAGPSTEPLRRTGERLLPRRRSLAGPARQFLPLESRSSDPPDRFRRKGAPRRAGEPVLTPRILLVGPERKRRNGPRCRFHPTAQSADSASACSSTVRVAFSCLSGG